LAAANLALWLWAWTVFQPSTVLLGSALIAYTLGLRHAVDADHIAAIDNVTRKLMQDGRRPYSVGLWFSLGHSTIVVLGALAIARAARALGGHWFAALGTVISALFLFAIGFVNLAIWNSIRHGQAATPGEPTGLLARLYRPVFGMIRTGWNMYPLGVLFGLGFDTATEVGVIAIAAAQATHGLSLRATLLFPALFAAGMALVDSTDCVLMVGAYGWAFGNPKRRRTYNLAITGASVIAALLVGGWEAATLLAHY